MIKASKGRMKNPPQHRLKRKEGPEDEKDAENRRSYARSVLPDFLGKFLNAAHSHFDTARRSLL